MGLVPVVVILLLFVLAEGPTLGGVVVADSLWGDGEEVLVDVDEDCWK